MPLAWPSTTTRSSISVRGNICTLPAAICRHKRLISAEQQLLAGLAARVKSARDLRAAEGAVGQQAAVFAGEGHALRDALVDDVDADLRQPVDVGLARAEVAALDRVVEEPVDAVAVVLVILRGVDAALGGDGVRAARAVLVAEAFHLVAQLGQRGGGRGARQAGADDDDLVLPPVGRVDQLRFELVLVPLFLDRAGGDVCVEAVDHGHKCRKPVMTAMGMAM